MDTGVWYLHGPAVAQSVQEDEDVEEEEMEDGFVCSSFSDVEMGLMLGMV